MRLRVSKVRKPGGLFNVRVERNVGHSGGYRSARAPEHGSWDFSGGDVWLNGIRVLPPSRWPFESLPWTGWGKGRIEVPLTEEGYFSVLL